MHNDCLQVSSHGASKALFTGIAVRGSLGNLGEDAVDQNFPPTILVNVNHTVRIMQEEVSLMRYIIVILLIIVSVTTDFLC
jgi:hypothetical protein